MEIQFFLPHKFIKELMNVYGFSPLDARHDPPAGDQKGLLFAVDFKHDYKGVYYAVGTAEMANGRPDRSTGKLPAVKGSLRILCPHPPPCEDPPPPGGDTPLASAEYIIDKKNPASSCYQ